jgi:hypothetical protein
MEPFSYLVIVGSGRKSCLTKNKIMTTLKIFTKRLMQLIISALAMISIMTNFFSKLEDVDFISLYIVGSFTIWTLLLSLEK